MAKLYTVSCLLSLALALVIQLQTIESQFFGPEYTKFDTALKGHVFGTYSGITSYFDCYLKCQSLDCCFSLNYHPSRGLCELSYTCHLGHVNDTVPTPHVTYLMVRTCSAGCISGALGLEDGSLPNSSITASSVYNYVRFPTWDVRLNGPNAWAPKTDKAGEYIEFDFGKVVILSRIDMQSSAHKSVEYVTSFKLLYRYCNEAWKEYKIGGNVKIFQGFQQQPATLDEAVTNVNFSQPARHVRFVPVEWVLWPVLRLEFYGCK